MTKPKTETEHAPSAQSMGRRHQITEARLQALYRAVMDMRGGHDAELEKAFSDAGESDD